MLRPVMMSAALVLATAARAQATPAPPEPARAAFERGEKALATNQPAEAVAAYKEALALAPGYAAAINGLGSALFKQDQKAEAIAQFRAAIQADPEFKLAYFNLGYAARKTADYATAVSAYEKYTQLEPNDPDGFYGLAESYRQVGQREKAISAYEAFVAREKRPSEQKWIDRAKESIAALRTELGGAEPVATPPAAPAAQPPPLPTSAPASSLSAQRIAAGDKAMAEKRYRDASFAYQDAVNSSPDNVEGLFKLGNAYAVLGYYPQAIDKWTRVLQVSSDAAVRTSAQENIIKAQSKMTQLGGGSPQSQGKPPSPGPVAPTIREQARVAYEQGVKQINGRDFAGAVMSLTTAVQHEPTLAVAYVARGSAYIGLKRYTEAVADYSYALKLDAGMSSPLYGLAEAYRAMGRVVDARSYYERYVSSSAPDVRPELKSDARIKAESLR